MKPGDRVLIKNSAARAEYVNALGAGVVTRVTAKRVVVLWPHARSPRAHMERTLELVRA
jgi:hypothetical protein